MEVGFTVEEAANGLEALDVIQKEKVDLALVDWNMPDMNGYEFIQEVRKDNAFRYAHDDGDHRDGNERGG